MVKRALREKISQGLLQTQLWLKNESFLPKKVRRILTTLVVKVLPTRQRGISLAPAREFPLPLAQKTRAQKRKGSADALGRVKCPLAVLFVRWTEEKILPVVSLTVIKWFQGLPSISAKIVKWTIFTLYTKGSSGYREMHSRFLTQNLTLRSIPNTKNLNTKSCLLYTSPSPRD